MCFFGAIALALFCKRSTYPLSSNDLTILWIPDFDFKESSIHISSYEGDIPSSSIRFIRNVNS